MKSAISIFGTDRPGVISAITKQLATREVNIEDASMTLLQGNFAMILVVESTAKLDYVEILKSDETLKSFEINSTDILDDFNLKSGEDCVHYVFHLSANDAPGIVSKVSEKLSLNNANIVDCSTRKNTETNIFTMILDADVPIANEQRLIDDINSIQNQFDGNVVFQRIENIDF